MDDGEKILKICHFQKRYTRRHWEWVARKHLEGHSIRDLAKFIGVNPKTVMKHVTDLHSRRPKPAPLETFREEFEKIGH